MGEHFAVPDERRAQDNGKATHICFQYTEMSHNLTSSQNSKRRFSIPLAGAPPNPADQCHRAEGEV